LEDVKLFSEPNKFTIKGLEKLVKILRTKPSNIDQNIAQNKYLNFYADARAAKPRSIKKQIEKKRRPSLDYVSKNIGKNAEAMTGEEILKEVRKNVEEKNKQQMIHQQAMTQKPLVNDDDDIDSNHSCLSNYQWENTRQINQKALKTNLKKKSKS
jgi:hypothetical protein